MALFEEQHEFASLHIPVSETKENLARQYRLYMQDGRLLEVLADSAADAVAKLGVKDNILRITSVAFESKRMLQVNILQALGTTVETNISQEVENHEPGALVLTEIIEPAKKEPFAFMNLVEYVDFKESHASGDMPHLFVTMEHGATSQDAMPTKIVGDEAQGVAVADALPPVDETEVAPQEIEHEQEFEPDFDVAAEVVEEAVAEQDDIEEDLTKGMSEDELAMVAEYLQAAANENIVELGGDEPDAEPELEKQIELSPEEVRNLLNTKDKL